MSTDKRTGRYSRFIVECPMRLEDASGALLDADATVRDIAGGGIGFQSRAALEEKALVRFTITLPQGAVVTGTAEIVWCFSDVKGSWAGARFVDVSRKDAALISIAAGTRGFDFGGLFDKTLLVATVAVVTLVARDLFDRPQFWRTAAALAPTLLAVAAIAVSALWFARNRR